MATLISTTGHAFPLALGVALAGCAFPIVSAPDFPNGRVSWRRRATSSVAWPWMELLTILCAKHLTPRVDFRKRLFQSLRSGAKWIGRWGKTTQSSLEMEPQSSRLPQCITFCQTRLRILNSEQFS